MAFSETALAAYTKKTFAPDFIENSMTKVMDSALKSVKRMTDGAGNSFAWLADADDSFVGAGSFATAQAAANANANTSGLQFDSQWNVFTGDAVIPSTIINRTRNNDGAWQEAVNVAMKKAINSFAHANAIFLQGYGWGEVSTIQSVSGSTFVPGIRSDITKYVTGMPIVFSQSLHGHVLRSTTVRYVTGVNYDDGQELVTLDGTLAGVSAVNGDTAFIADCRENSATPNRIAPAGLGVWFPNRLTDMGDATVTTLLTQNRLRNSRYFGNFVDATGGGSAKAQLIIGCQRAITIGNATSLELFCSQNVFSGIANDLDSAVRFDGNPAQKSIGTRRLLVYADGQAEAHLNVSRTTNDNQIWGFDPTSIVMKSIGAAPAIDAEDGQTLKFQSTALGYEIRWLQQMILQFKSPATGLRIQLV